MFKPNVPKSAGICNPQSKSINMWRRILTPIFTTVLCAMAAAAQAASEDKPIRIALSLSPLSSPYIVALEKGYFNEVGLAPTVTKVIGGNRAAEVLFSGDADIATSSETVVMFHSFKRSDFGVFATFVSSDNDVKLLAREDAKIRSLADLPGHRVGITKGASSQFFLDHTLMMNRIVKTNIDFVHVNPEAAASALESGDVDAVAVWEPIGCEILKKPGAGIVEVPHDRLYIETFNSIAMREFAENNAPILRNVLRALIKAEDFIVRNEEESKRIVSSYLDMDFELLDAIWNDFEFTITLDQSLIASLEAEARWAIREALIETEGIPNYLDFLMPDPLVAVSPQSSTVFQ